VGPDQPFQSIGDQQFAGHQVQFLELRARDQFVELLAYVVVTRHGTTLSGGSDTSVSTDRLRDRGSAVQLALIGMGWLCMSSGNPTSRIASRGPHRKAWVRPDMAVLPHAGSVDKPHSGLELVKNLPL
jgi:hypothetical protein